jgi:hypothetical protein
MPKDAYLTKHQIWGVRLLAGFFGALRGNLLTEFLTSDELERFLREAAGGSFGGKVPDGTPGSKFPGVGVSNPLDVLHDIFNSLGSGLGEIDRSGEANPAAADGDRVTIGRSPDGTIQTDIVHRDGTRDSFVMFPDGSYQSEHTEGPGHYDRVHIVPGAHPGEVTIYEYHGRPGYPEVGTRIVYPAGRQHNSPGEDGSGDTNSDPNPLSGINILGPQSMQQMLNQMKHPGKNPDKLDPNSGAGGITFTEEDKERLGRIVPSAEVLDPNSGVDPLTQLAFDPNQMRTRSEKDDRVDPNTGLKPKPGGG